jgi:hypothetical protein
MASIVRAKRIGELRTRNNREHNGVIFQKTAFFIVAAVETSDLTPKIL